MTEYEFFGTVPRHMELLLAEELKGFGARNVQHTVAGVAFTAPLKVGYRAVLWSRLANTILLRLSTCPASTPEELYEGVQRIAWDKHLDIDKTFAVTFTTIRSEMTHTKYGALKVKDAVVDQFRDAYQRRPSIDVGQPDVRINCHVDKDEATLSIDLAGDSLHRRSYRQASGKAPLKENVAAAILLRAKWPRMMAEKLPLVDPMCGSGTLLIEAAWMASDHAPGLLRDYFGFQGWKHHKPEVWKRLIEEAEKRRDEGLKNLGTYRGSDINKSVISDARENVEAAGLTDFIHLERQAIKDITPPSKTTPPGLVVTNAPYGERLGDDAQAVALHREFGDVLKEKFPGWKASVFTGSEELGFKLGMRAHKIYKLYNGSLECLLLNFDIRE